MVEQLKKKKNLYVFICPFMKGEPCIGDACAFWYYKRIWVKDEKTSTYNQKVSKEGCGFIMFLEKELK